MNESIRTEAQWAFLAGLVEGRSSVYVHRNKRPGGEVQYRLNLKVWVSRHLAPSIAAWLDEAGVKPRRMNLEDAGLSSQYWLHFMDREVGRIFTHILTYLVSDRRREQAKLVFRFFKTRQKPGIRLTSDELAERQKVRHELKAVAWRGR